jgi:flagellar biosynthesis/type III secretory pathway chaperone
MASTQPAAGELAALVECLEDEYRALLAEDIGQLHAVLTRKQQLLTLLAGVPADLGLAYGNLRQEAAPFPRALARLHEMNRRNAQVLAPRLAGIRTRLRFLQAAVGHDSVYSADGSLTTGAFRAAFPRSA